VTATQDAGDRGSNICIWVGISSLINNHPFIDDMTETVSPYCKLLNKIGNTSTVGGDATKGDQLILATVAGNLQAVTQHLNAGVDPNFTLKVVSVFSNPLCRNHALSAIDKHRMMPYHVVTIGGDGDCLIVFHMSYERFQNYNNNECDAVIEFEM
jgi:hypothetical protein